MVNKTVPFVSRILMFCLALAMLLCSVFLVVWGSMMADSTYDRRLKDVVFNYDSPEPLADDKYDMRAWIWTVYWSMYGLSIAAVLISLIGMIGAVNRRKAVAATFLVVFVPFVVIEIVGSVTVWTKRGQIRRLIYRFVNDMYAVNSIVDIATIQNTYNCCGVRNGAIACSGEPLCDVTVFNSVDNAMMITGLVLIPVLISQFLLMALPVAILKFEPREEKKNENNGQLWSTAG